MIWISIALDQLWVGSTDVIWWQVVSLLITQMYIVWWYSLSVTVLFGDIRCQWLYCLVIFLVSDNIVRWFSLSVYQLLVIFLGSDSSVWWYSMSVTLLFGDIPCQCTNSFVTRSKCWTSTSSVSKPLPPPLLQLLLQIPIQFCLSDLYLSFLCGPLCESSRQQRDIVE